LKVWSNVRVGANMCKRHLNLPGNTEHLAVLLIFYYFYYCIFIITIDYSTDISPQAHDQYVSITMWAPETITKLVQITSITLVYDTCNELVNGVDKLTYYWGGTL
jgi:hypothetical protein